MGLLVNKETMNFITGKPLKVGEDGGDGVDGVPGAPGSDGVNGTDGVDGSLDITKVFFNIGDNLPTLDTAGGTNYPTREFRFTDSGGPTNVYSPGENYTITFDAGSGYTWDMFVDDLAFENATYSGLYDKLKLQVSSDGGNTFTDVTGINWTRDDGGSPITAGPYFPAGMSELASRGYNSSTGESLPYQFIRFVFVSDSAQNLQGWSIRLRTTNPAHTGSALSTADIELDNTTNNFIMTVHTPTTTPGLYSDDKVCFGWGASGRHIKMNMKQLPSSGGLRVFTKKGNHVLGTDDRYEILPGQVNSDVIVASLGSSSTNEYTVVSVFAPDDPSFPFYQAGYFITNGNCVFTLTSF